MPHKYYRKKRDPNPWTHHPRAGITGKTSPPDPLDRAGRASQTPKSALGICAMTYYRSTGAPVDRGHTTPCNRNERTKAPVTKGVHERRATQSLPSTSYNQRGSQPADTTLCSITTITAMTSLLKSPPHMPPPPSTTAYNLTWSQLRPDAQPFTPGAIDHRRHEHHDNRTSPPHPPPTTLQTRQHQTSTLMTPPQAHIRPQLSVHHTNPTQQ